MTGPLLPRAFFERDVVTVARELVGRYVVRDADAPPSSGGAGRVVLRITEVEAYCGPTDTAAHSRAGRTPRTEVMFGPAGHAYVYLCYGIHWMLNLVTGGRGDGQAVLVRACEVHDGLDVVLARRRPRAAGAALTPRARAELVAGPGKVAQALALDASWNRHDVCAPGGLAVHDLDDADRPDVPLLVGPRVGIDFASAKDRRALLRFALDGSPAVTARASLRHPRASRVRPVR